MKAVKTLLAMALAAASAHLSAATEGVDYQVVKTPFEQVQKDKVEVLEFFAYWCPHCSDLDPIILKHSKTFASDTYFRTEHVVWEPARDVGFARIAAAVNQSGLKYSVNPVIFDAVVKQGKTNLADPAVFSKWAVEQKAFDGKKLLAAYESFSNQTQVKQMANWTAEYNIESTPTVIVGGKYQVTFNNGFAEGMKTIDELVQKVREERGMKTPAPRAAVKPVKSRGAAFVSSAVK